MRDLFCWGVRAGGRGLPVAQTIQSNVLRAIACEGLGGYTNGSYQATSCAIEYG